MCDEIKEKENECKIFILQGLAQFGWLVGIYIWSSE